jgi:hypothetical protein
VEGNKPVRCGWSEAHPTGLARRDPADRLGLRDKQAGLARLDELVAQLAVLHNRLWAEQER